MSTLLSKSRDASTQGKALLRLYNQDYCSYCRKVKHEANRLGIELGILDIYADGTARERLRAATGRTRVPVLGIVDENGEETFLPESDDIILYLRKRAEGA